MSAFGTKRTYRVALHMSAFGGKADMPFCTANVRYWGKADIQGFACVALSYLVATSLASADPSQNDQASHNNGKDNYLFFHKLCLRYVICRLW
jgi:hypothetical protein